jgi:Response regulator containing CheY-like receiver, AAA-type ATPase, and DNA-binding domains
MKRRKRTGPPRYTEQRRRVLREFETKFVIDVLQRTGGNVSEAARLAGMDRKHLWRLMQRNGITVEAAP